MVGATVAELTRDGYLAPCDALAPVAEVKGIAQDPVEAVRAHAPDRRVVVFQRSVEYSRDCCARGGPRWAHVDGKTPAGERAATLERFARGELDVLSNVFVLTEGWDCPAADVVVLARSFGSVATYLQAVGRVLRVPTERPDKRALIVDLGENVLEHGMPAAEREFGLGDKPIARRAPACALCRQCGAVRRGEEPACWRCARVFPPPPRPAVRNVALAEFDGAALTGAGMTHRKRAELARLEAFARSRGYKPGWIAHRFKARFGHFPPRAGVAA